jgi:predicted RNA-binding protein YlqC (UPF0109 family)
MEALVRIMAQALVDYPEKVSVNTIDSNQTTILELRVAKEDTGKVIGKKGRTADAFRTILGAVAAKERKHILFEIIDTADKQSAGRPRAPA